MGWVLGRGETTTLGCFRTKWEGADSVGADLVSGFALLVSSWAAPLLVSVLFSGTFGLGRGRDACAYQSHVLSFHLLSSGTHLHHWQGSLGGSPCTPYPFWEAHNWAHDTGYKEPLVWRPCPQGFGKYRTPREFLEKKWGCRFSLDPKENFCFLRKILAQIWS